MREQVFDNRRSWIEIDLQSLRYNVQQILTQLQSKDQLMAVVKSDAYGHGAVKISQELNKMGIYSFAVATLSEGIELRKNGVIGQILILGYTDPYYARMIQEYDLTQTVIDYQYALSLQQQNIPICVHIALDTGMHRLGEMTHNLSQIKNIFQFSSLHITGMFSHLCVCDETTNESQNYTLSQIQYFCHTVNQLKKEGYNVGKVHLLSSYGFIYYPHYQLDYVRMGILLYGVDSSFPKQMKLSLKPVLSLKSKIALIKKVSQNQTIGYGRTYTTTQCMKIAVVPIGYADGLPRSLSNIGKVIVKGQFAPIVGRICMDQMMIDVTHIYHVERGDIVTIIGEDHVYQGVETIAKQSCTISNEILSQLGFRLPKIYINEMQNITKIKSI